MKIRRFLGLLVPPKETVVFSEIIYSSLAAFVAIALTYLISQYYLSVESAIFLVASMGATAFLVFAIPHGPLSQPWPIFGGHICSACIGVVLAQNLPDPLLAASLAVSVSIAIMFLLRCLHPPGAATALIAIVGGDEVHQLAYLYILNPVALNVCIILAWAVVINNLLPRRWYPSVLRSSHQQEKKLGRNALQISQDDMSDALRKMGIYVDISKDELEPILNTIFLKFQQNKIGNIRCQDVMTFPVIYAHQHENIDEILTKLSKHHIRSIPVINRTGLVMGIITMNDILKYIDDSFCNNVAYKLKMMLQKKSSLGREKKMIAAKIMTKPAICFQQQQHIQDVFILMSEQNIHHFPVVNEEQQLVGIITPNNLLNAAYLCLQQS